VVTFAEDLTERAEMDAAIVDLAHRTLAEVVEQGRTVTRVAVTVRTKTFFTRTKIRKLGAQSIDESIIVDTALSVFDQFVLDRPVRLLGVRLELAMPEAPVAPPVTADT
jgi:DNA polymerase-4